MAGTHEEVLAATRVDLETHGDALRRLTKKAVDKAFENAKQADTSWKDGKDNRPLTTVE